MRQNKSTIIRIAPLLLLLLSLQGCSDSSIKKTPVYHIQSGNDLNLFITTDIHYLSPSLTDGGTAFQRDLSRGDGKLLQYSDELMKAFSYDIQIQRPEITVISGDLTNNGEKQSHLDMAAHLASIEEDTGTQVYVIPGNHDLLNPWAKSFKGRRQFKADTLSPKAFKKIYGPFGYDEAISRDRHSLSYLATPSDQLWLLMLDTNLYKHNKELRHPQLEGRLSTSTLKWIDTCGELARQKGATIVGVMHHSLLDHSKFIQEGFTIQNKKDVRDVLMRNGIQSVFSGHIHIQDISKYQQGSHTIHDIANSALSVYPHQFGKLTYSNTDHTLDFSTSPLHMDVWAASNGVTDPNLEQFKTYSESSFGQLSVQGSYQRLTQNSSFAGYTEHQLQAMADVIRLLHMNYFAGMDVIDKKKIMLSEGYQIWLGAPSSPMRSYVLRLAEPRKKDNHHLHLILP